MTTVRRKSGAQRAAPRSAGPDGAARRLEHIAAALAVALAVARPVFPPDDADSGSGLVIVSFWGVVAILWAVAQAVRGELRWFAGPVDLCVALLLGAAVVSVARADSLRPAINMASEWAGLVVSYFLVRQLFRDASLQRSLVIAMLATAVTLAAYGIYQTFWGLELTRAQFQSNPARELAKVGIAPGTPEAAMFVNRLNSHEPFATFALANSLAGFLVAWFPLGVAWLVERRANPATAARPTAFWILGAGGVLAVLLCLILTQSRTAYAALALQFTGLVLYYGVPLAREHGRRWLRAWLVAGFLAAVCVAITLYFAVRRGKIDEKLLTQATKSLAYRWEYWQATAGLIREYCWGGVGPGNFRGHYLRYKLPASSEEIADPHNLVLEVWSTSGAIAAAALLAALGWGLARVARRCGGVREPDQSVPWLAVLAAGFGGWVLAVVLSAPEPLEYAVMAVVWTGAVVLLVAAAPDQLVPPRVIALAGAGLVIHLTGAGGIGTPGVGQSLWQLLAVGLTAAHPDERPWRTQRQPAVRAVPWLVGAVVIGFGYFVLGPVTASLAELSAGRARMLEGDALGAERHFLAAAKHDALAAEPWMGLARIHYERWQYAQRRRDRRKADDELEHAVEALEKAMRLMPSRLEPKSQLAALLAGAAAGEPAVWPGQPQLWPRAAEAYARCVAVYPTSAFYRARLAESLLHAGQFEQARPEMARALQLDAQTPHADKKLTDKDRNLFEGLLRVHESAPEEPTLKGGGAEVE